MMAFFFYLVFMIPMLGFNFWYCYQFMYMYFIFVFMLINVNYDFCNVGYLFGIDFFSYNLVILSFFIISLMNLSSLYMINLNSLFFCLINYLICIILFFVFCFLNMFMMYISFEFVLIPLLILVLGWGYQPERLESGIYLFFYTLFGSFPLFIFIIYIYNDFFTLLFCFEFNFDFNFFLYWGVMIPFLIKLPMFILHFWLPKAHVQAPISGSMILAGLILKIGGYGLIRFLYVNDLFFYYSYIWFSLGMVGFVVVGFICLVQVDIKCLIAYSSIGHMSLCLMAILTMTKIGLMGSLVLMVSHGLCSSGLFCLANMCYSRVLSRSIFLIKGMIFYMPSLCLFWFLFSCFNMGCPPSINFMAELLIMICSIHYFDYSYFYLIIGSFMCACFCFYLFSYSQHGSFLSMYSYSNIMVCEFLIVINHFIPLLSLMFFYNLFL
uniref:NADH dehydrogenase subunit 4 n=1 Tax=Sinocentrus brevicornis TaxID=3038129 RepID=UPI002551E317|nr:NADH dehydrogenase subunit 4 [Sinocentrus brevicornis]WFD60961.1 NADH dehydrogenase subunit 4 [Sinocentrus brevicornis]